MQLIKDDDQSESKCYELKNFTNAEGKDFSGFDFKQCLINDEEKRNFNHTYFKGCLFSATIIHNISFKHVEFDETVICEQSHFENCHFDSSDFIYNMVENTIFEDCTFINGEWRESLFSNVTFKNCNFEGATINLCKFDNCFFDDFSSKTFHGKGKNFNVFHQTIFPFCELSILGNNFGLVGHQKLLKHNDSIDSGLFNLSYLYYSNSLLGKVFIDNILDILASLVNNKSRNFQAKIKYVVNIVKMMAKNNLSLMHIEYLYSQLALSIPHITNQLLFIEIINLLTSINEIAETNKKNIEKLYQQYANQKKTGYYLEFEFYNSYSIEEMNVFLDSLCTYLQISPKTIELLSYSTGSTKITALIKTILLLTTLLESINYFLPQVSAVIKNSHDVYNECISFKKDVELNVNNNILKILKPMDITTNRDIIHENTTEILKIEGKVNIAIS